MMSLRFYSLVEGGGFQMRFFTRHFYYGLICKLLHKMWKCGSDLCFVWFSSVLWSRVGCCICDTAGMSPGSSSLSLVSCIWIFGICCIKWYFTCSSDVQPDDKGMNSCHGFCQYQPSFLRVLSWIKIIQRSVMYFQIFYCCVSLSLMCRISCSSLCMLVQKIYYSL